MCLLRTKKSAFIRVHLRQRISNLQSPISIYAFPNTAASSAIRTYIPFCT